MKHFFLYIEITSNNSRKHKEILWKKARKRYKNFSEEEKDKTQKKAREIYQNLTEEEKEKKHPNHRERNKKSFWGTKAEASSVYEKLLFST